MYIACIKWRKLKVELILKTATKRESIAIYLLLYKQQNIYNDKIAKNKQEQ